MKKELDSGLFILELVITGIILSSIYIYYFFK